MTIDFSRRRRLMTAIGLTALAPLTLAAPQNRGSQADYGAGPSVFFLINKAGNQRLQALRMNKAWAMQALGVEPQMAARIRRESEALFINQLADLEKVAPTSEIAAATTALRQAWENYRRDLTLAPGKENATRVYISGDKTRDLANTLTELYEKRSGVPEGHLVNIAARQRARSQRMACAFYYGKLNAAVDTVKHLEIARKEYLARARELMSAPQNTPSIKQELALIEPQWLFFQIAIDSGNRDPNAYKNIATTSERILEQLSVVVNKYVELAEGN